MKERDNVIVTPMDEHILNALEGLQPGTLLEVGSGGGRLTNRLAQLGWKITGIEPDPWYRELTSTFFNKIDGVECQIIDGDIQNLEFPDNSFDVVISNAVIEHVQNPVLGISEMLRCSRNRFVITTPYGHEADSPDHIHHFYEDDIEALFDPTSFDASIVMDRPGGNKTWMFVGTFQ
ncbi:class I SAM-dependent methyltransferase [Dehalococcoides mccartyi]|nr:class I SAM-dependent methyltransferase [Dehalococcoides mccartyi]